MPQNRIVRLALNWYLHRDEPRISSNEPGHDASQVYRAPVEWRHELQWQHDALRGSEARSTVAVNL